MKTRVITLLLAAGLFAVAALTALSIPAAAQTQTVYVRLADGSVVPVTVDVPPGSSLDDIQLPGTPVPAPAPPTPPTPTTPTTPSVPKPPDDRQAGACPAGRQRAQLRRRLAAGAVRLRTSRRGATATASRELVGEVEGRAKDEISRAKRRGRRSPLRNADGTPTPSNPGFVDVLPGPSTATGVPNFMIRKFRVPPFLLSIYQAAGIEYGVRWEVLAAINEIETDYGRNLNVSSAGALGWMQFMPATWKMYGTDANKDGRKDPFNPVDAIFSAARYLKAANYENDVRAAIWAYNHADWYVDSVLLRARLIAGVPADLIGSLTGLTEGRFPVVARARYADDIAEQQLLKRVKQGENAANVVESDDSRRSIDIFASKGSPVVAVNDGVIKKIGRNKKLGRHVVLQDVYGNRYTYAHLGQVSQRLSGPEERHRPGSEHDRQRDERQRRTRSPTQPASAGRQLDASDKKAERDRGGDVPSSAAQASAPVKQRLFAHPDLPGSREAGGLEQQLDAEARKSGKYETYKNYFSRPFGLDPSKVRLRPLKKGSRVIGGTIVGRIGQHPVRQGLPRGVLDPPRRPRRAEDRPEADPRRLEAARGHGDLPRLGPQRALRQGQRRRHVDRPDHAAAEAAAREARPLRRAHRDLRVRPRRHPLRPDRPPRARHPGLPRRVRPEARRHLPQVRPRLLHRLAATSPSTPRATPSTSPRSTASRSSATRSRAGSPSRPCAA